MTTTTFATSADGTRIAYEATGSGSGPALIVVDGAMCSRTMGPSRDIAKELRDRFTVIAYDRRGRGESGPGESPYHFDREVEDIAALLDAAGGHAHVLGFSSGASLALEAARAGLPIDRLATYEAPYIVDGTHGPNDLGLGDRTRRLVDDGARGTAVALFMKLVGMPKPMIWVMRVTPVWRKVTAVAHTLPYDYSLTLRFQQGRPLPDGYYAGIDRPTWVGAGGKSPAYMRNAQDAVAAQIPGSQRCTLEGQTHMVKAQVIAPAVADFLLAGAHSVVE